MEHLPPVGTKVRITPHLTTGNDWATYVAPDMAKYAGQTATVTDTFWSSVRLSIDNSTWSWTPDLLQPATFQTKRRGYGS
jgi:hypothetical protein